MCIIVFVCAHTGGSVIPLLINVTQFVQPAIPGPPGNGLKCIRSKNS